MTLLAVAMSVNLCSCNSDDEEATKQNKDIIVSLGFEGEYEVSELPLSRVTSDDLYLVAAYIIEGSYQKPYAYGLFDDISAIKIKLTKDVTYGFFAYIIKNGKNKLQHTENNYGNAPYPFSNMELSNEFIYSDNSISFGPNFKLSDGKTYQMPNLDVYIAANMVEYTPTENGKVSIAMLRSSFGIKVIAENLTEGSLNIGFDVDGNSEQKIVAPNLIIKSPNTTVEDIFLLPISAATIVNGDFTLTSTISFIWEKDDMTEITLGAPTITFKRNKLTTIKIKVDKSIKNSIEFEYADSTEMGDGGTYNIHGDTATEETKE